MIHTNVKRTLLTATLVAAASLAIPSTVHAASPGEFLQTNLKLDLGASYQFQNQEDVKRTNPRSVDPFTIGSARRGGILSNAAQAPGVDHTRNRRTDILRFNFN